MMSRMHIGMFIGLALFAWVVLLWVRGVQLSWEYLWPYGLVVINPCPHSRDFPSAGAGRGDFFTDGS